MLICSYKLFSQDFSVEGKVVDAETLEPLAFVSIVINDGLQGNTTDIDGKFRLHSFQPISSLRLSYVGYYSKSFYIKDPTSFLTIPLRNKKTEIGEVYVKPGENPANRIIQQVIESRKINNPEKQHSFSYNSYNKFLVTAVKQSEKDTNIFITDTVEFQKLLPDTFAQSDKSILIEMGGTKTFNLDSGQIVSMLQDTQLIHQVLKPLLKDSQNIKKVQLGFVFLRDNPTLVKKYILKSDSTLTANIFSDGLNSFIHKYFSDTVNATNVIEAVDSLMHVPAVLSILVPAIDSVLNDTALMSRIMPYLNIEKQLMSRLSEEIKHGADDDFNIDKQHIFLMESATKRDFLFPDYSYEKVLASRVSGFREPLFVLLASQIQSFTFYNDVIDIGNRIYVNPISPGSIHKYFFLIQDTIYNAKDTVFIISFQPKRNKNFEALEGVLYINTNTYAIENVIAKSARTGFLNIKIQQKYDYVDHTQWFPVQLNTEVTINPEYVHYSTNDNQYIPIGVGRTYIKDIELNPELRRRDFNQVAVEMDESVANRKDDFWNKYRVAPLNTKEIRTYQYMDSIGRVAHLDRYARSFFILKSGFVPAGIFNIDIKNVIRYNQYEGLRLGLDVQTNHKFSDWFRPGGYVAYGTRDKEWKFSGNINLLLDKRKELETGLYYAKDVEEHGVEEIFQNNSLFSDAYWRSFLYSNLASARKYGVEADFRLFNYFKWKGMITHSDYTTRFDPSTTDPEFIRLPQKYKITEVSLGFRFAYKEKLIETPQQKFIKAFSQETAKTKYPTFWFQYSAGIDYLGGSYTYSRFDVKIEKSFYLRYVGTSSFKVEGGIIDRKVPIVRLFNGKASYRVFTIDVPNSFATMRMNEFFSDQYFSVFFDHNFGTLLIRSENFKPEFHLITNMMFGKLDHLPVNQRIYKTPEKGYFESGMMIRKLVNLKICKIGLGAYYRYGTYTYEKVIDNFSFRISVSSPF